MPVVETRQGPIAYAARGAEGPALLFIHGAGGSYRHWGQVMGELPKGSRRYAIDLPGHGRSPGPARGSIAEYGVAVEAWMDALGIEGAALVGHSMGGAIALWLALEHPARVAGLGLVGSGGRLRVAPWLLAGVREAPAETLARLAPLLYGPAASPDLLQATVRELTRVAPDVLENDYRACDDFDVLERLGRIGAPAVVVCGTADRMTPPKYSEYLARQLPQARLELIPDVGHMPMIEAPQAVARAIAPLLQPGATTSDE